MKFSFANSHINPVVHTHCNHNTVMLRRILMSSWKWTRVRGL